MNLFARPNEQAEHFAILVQQCCEQRRRRRPKLKEIVLPYLNSLYEKAYKDTK
jgi:hypothetical protein